jgi:hypothetical protein
MKKSMLCMATALLLVSFTPMQLKAVTLPSGIPVDSTKNIESAEINALTHRLEEINGMDKSKLTSPERRQLRKEVRTIKKQAKALSGGVYVSAGALIVLLILLIVLL